MSRFIASSSAWLTAILLTVVTAQVVEAQSRDRRDQASPMELEKRLEKAEETLLDEYKTVASELYKQDAKEESLAVLQRIQRINPRMEGLKEEIERLREELLSSNDIDTKIDTGKGWGVALANVTAGKAVRIQAVGDYRLTLTTPVPMTGLPTENPQTDHSRAAPFGALIGVVVGDDGKPGEPFPVTASTEFTPKSSGQLFLRVNVPVAAKCTGDIKVRITGGVTPAAKRR
ncbi:MAG: hypothetical protein KDA96_15565 [Planctomycetaceae bacterium]|nr:hypothetical protein [Planctomycetaceae bacterium]